MSELNCAAYRDDLLWYAAGHSDGEKRAAIAAHLARCADCRAEVAQWRGVAASIHRDTGEVPTATFQATWQRIQSQLPPQPQLNGSTILTGVIHMEFENDAQSVTPIKTRQPQQAPTPRRTKWFAAVAALLVVLMSIAIFGVLHARNQAASLNGTPITLPAGARLVLPSHWEINRAAIVSEDDIWSVGVIRGPGWSAYGSYGAYGDAAMILHYSGGQWRVVSSSEYANSALESISMVSATEGWAVGFTDPHPHGTATAGPPQKQTSVPLILHYHDGAWTKVAAPPVIGTLYDVQMGTTGEGIATGFDVNDADTLLLHYKNGVWSNSIAVPVLYTPDDNTLAYAIAGNSGVWALGKQGVYRFQNNQWQLFTNTSEIAPNSVLSDIAVTGPADVWVELATQDAPISKAKARENNAVAHFDGTKWTLIALPANHFGGGFRSHTSWLQVAQTGGDQNQLARLENGQWKVSTIPLAFPTDGFLITIKDISPTASIALRADGHNGINIYHYQNGTWS